MKSQIAFLLGRRVRAIRAVSSQELLGCVVFTDIDKGHKGYAEIGYFVSAPHQHKSIGTRAVLRFVDWGISNLGLKKIVATANPQNVPSVKLLERIGLSQVGKIEADQTKYVGRHGCAEARVVMSGDLPAIQKALDEAKFKGLYSASLKVI